MFKAHVCGVCTAVHWCAIHVVILILAMGMQGPASKQQLDNIGLRLLHLPHVAASQAATPATPQHHPAYHATTPSRSLSSGKENLPSQLNSLSLDGTVRGPSEPCSPAGSSLNYLPAEATHDHAADRGQTHHAAAAPAANAAADREADAPLVNSHVPPGEPDQVPPSTSAPPEEIPASISGMAPQSSGQPAPTASRRILRPGDVPPQQ